MPEPRQQKIVKQRGGVDVCARAGDRRGDFRNRNHAVQHRPIDRRALGLGALDRMDLQLGSDGKLAGGHQLADQRMAFAPLHLLRRQFFHVIRRRLLAVALFQIAQRNDNQLYGSLSMAIAPFHLAFSKSL